MLLGGLLDQFLSHSKQQYFTISIDNIEHNLIEKYYIIPAWSYCIHYKKDLVKMMKLKLMLTTPVPKRKNQLEINVIVLVNVIDFPVLLSKKTLD